ncbi:hypothetical protein F5Y01DRAFT_294534 [Xylaria sp. FL0043]|nr:hypothetical protein F5Y01DRAFT_294534 [Xylaria sp. FL0043]
MADEDLSITSWEDDGAFESFESTQFEGEHATDRVKGHRCLLAEIISAENFIRPRLVCRDREGNEFIVAFYHDDEADMPRILKHFKPGNTIALFNAVGHSFLDGSIGVRVENSHECMIIPLKLRDAITMNRQAKEFVNRDGTPRRCHGCGSKAKADLSKCGRCELFRYCNRDCQTNGWQDHKKFCKVLKDENVKKILMLDFENADDGVISFS